jgi:hypothetical protein
MKNSYEALDELGYPKPAAFVFPPIPCGHYTATLRTGEEVHFKFRRMPRVQNHTGRFGVFLKDPDAGDVLISLMYPGGDGFEGVKSQYPAQLLVWMDIFRNKVPYTTTKTQCSWCGRDLTGAMIEGKIHDKCIDKII